MRRRRLASLAFPSPDLAAPEAHLWECPENLKKGTGCMNTQFQAMRIPTVCKTALDGECELEKVRPQLHSQLFAPSKAVAVAVGRGWCRRL